ncbi:hypothetical protein BKI52_35975 [marine bacterium AO1-C]|nr:hypothetical protein BKI52_35975 [marine bacterium AO1-C]
MRFLNGLLIIAVFAFMTACGGGAKTENTEGTATDSASTTETANTDNTEKKNEETTSSETKAPKDMLAQKWSFDADAILAAMMETATEEEKKAMTDESKEEMKKEMAKETMEFKADGTYINTDAKGKEEKGTWTLSEDGKTLTTKAEGQEKEDVIVVKELTADKMVGEMKVGDKTRTLVMKVFAGESTEGTTETKEGEKKEGETKEGEKKEGEKTEEKK